MFIRNLSVLLGTLLLIFTVTDVSAYSKYGRTCQDIGCRSDEFCVIAEDACSTYERKNCGQYPTCKKKSDGASCSSLICGPNEYCRTENGHPQCVRKTSSNVPTPSRSGYGQYYPAQRTTIRPTPPRPSFGDGRVNGHSGSRNTIGSGSIWSRLFGGDRGAHDRTTPRTIPTARQGGRAGYYDTHRNVDRQGNVVFTFSG